MSFEHILTCAIDAIDQRTMEAADGSLVDGSEARHQNRARAV